MNDKFSFHKFFIKITSRKLLIWIMSTIFTSEVIHNGSDSITKLAIVIAWGVLSIFYMIGAPLEQAFAAAVAKMELKINNTFNTNVQSSINATGIDKK